MTPRKAFSPHLDDQGILTITLDVPGEKVNTLGREMMGEFEALLGELEGRSDVRGAVLWSGKADSFIAGANVREFGDIRSALEGETLSRGAQALLDRLEALPMPVVAAIHGACLGGGLEVALACGYRIASADPRTALGLPEVMLGLIPGAGGTQRLPRLIGLPLGLELILTGRALDAKRAKAAGLLDEVVPFPILLGVARGAARGLAEGKLKPRSFAMPLSHRLARPFILSRARASVREKGRGHYPAPQAAIDVVELGLSTSFAEGLKAEARRFGELSVSPVSRALVSVFLATQEIRRDAGYPAGTIAPDVQRLGVVGAGFMGAGIAGSAVEAGVQVRFKDVTTAALGKGMRQVRDLMEDRRRRGSMSPMDREKTMDRLSWTLEYSGFRRAELVIEAVFEDLDIKRRVLADMESATAPDCVFASNTSAIPVREIARDSHRPSRVVGMHFFSPVHKMPLLEVVVTPESDAWSTAAAVGFGRRLKKHVIVVRDGPGFYTTRTLSPYMNEAVRLLEEGAEIGDIDSAMTAFGFPVGPLTLLDEVGLDVASKVGKTLHRHLGDRLAAASSVEQVIQDGRLGRKSGRGFYTYAGKKKPDHSVYALLGGGVGRQHFDPRVIQERLVFAFLNEAVLCLEEGILRSPRDGDVGAIFGLGFPPFLGGPFRYLGHLGSRFVLEVLEGLHKRYGERFHPAPLLTDLEKQGKDFYS